MQSLCISKTGGWRNEEAVSLVRMIAETSWMGNKQFAISGSVSRTEMCPSIKTQSNTACLDPDRRSRGKELRTEKSANELVNRMTEGILQMER